ncbi:AraC family transcriptional regulator [Micromonospora profundi]|uniref:AraC family transcriptional regulator n=1 Tax=Micromonospora TaxID=1873 RepID=UPI0033B4FEF0
MSQNSHAASAYRRIPLQDRQSIPRHTHRVPQLLVPTCGVVGISTPTGTWVVAGPAYALFVPAGLPHAHLAHTRSVIATVLLVDAPSTLTGTGEPTLVFLTELARHVVPALVDHHRDGTERPALHAVLVQELASRGPTRRSCLRLPEPRDPRLVALAETLRQDPADQRGLTQHARALATSQRTLSRLMATELGLSFPRWRAMLRLAAALDDLAAGRSVNETAHRCGFTSTSAFIALFRSVLHVTPGRYQRYLNDDEA